MPHMLTIALYFVVPALLAVASSRRVRAWLRGTGSIRQTASNAGVGVVFLLVQLGLRAALLAFYAAVAHLIPWKLPESAPWAWVLGFVVLDGRAVTLQHTAGFGEFKAAVQAHEQRLAESFLQPLDALGQRRLGDVQGFGRARKIQLARERHERFDLYRRQPRPHGAGLSTYSRQS